MKTQLLKTVAFISIVSMFFIGCCDKRCSSKGSGVDDETLGTLSNLMTSYDADEADLVRKELVKKLKESGFTDLVIEAGPRDQNISYNIHNVVDAQTQDRICEVLETIRRERKSKPMTVKFYGEENIIKVVELK